MKLSKILAAALALILLLIPLSGCFNGEEGRNDDNPLTENRTPTHFSFADAPFGQTTLLNEGTVREAHVWREWQEGTALRATPVEHENVKIMLLYIGYGFDYQANQRYAAFTEEDIQTMTDLGMDEFLLLNPQFMTTYYPLNDDGTISTERRHIVREEHVEALTMEMTGQVDEFQLELLRDELLRPGRNGIRFGSDNLLLNTFVDDHIELIETIVSVNPDARIWLSFPEIWQQVLSYAHVGPFLDIMFFHMRDRINAIDPEIWERNIVGYYWGTEGQYGPFDTSCTEFFGNETLRAARSLGEVVRGEGKKMLWLPYFGVGSDELQRRIGFIANQSDIFDYVLIQPNTFFSTLGGAGGVASPRVWDILLQIYETGAFKNAGGVVMGGEKRSSTTVGIMGELDGNVRWHDRVAGNTVMDYAQRWQRYEDFLLPHRNTQSFAFYGDGRNIILNPIVLHRLAKFWVEGDEAYTMYPIFDHDLDRPFASATERARYLAGETDVEHPTWDEEIIFHHTGNR